MTDHAPSVAAPASLRLAVLTRLVEEAAEEMVDRRLNVSVRVRVTEAKNYARGGYSSGHTRELEAALRAESVAAPEAVSKIAGIADAIREAGMPNFADILMESAAALAAASPALDAALEAMRQVHARHDLGHEIGAWPNACALCEADRAVRATTPASGAPAAPREEQP